MRRAGWGGLLVTSLACSGGPSPVVVEREAAPVEVVVEPAGPSTRADDPLLAHARGQMRRGRVPDDVREQLLASRDPEHRRAARLLQAVAGETPAASLPRADVEREPAAVQPAPPVPTPPKPIPSAPPEPTVAVAVDPAEDARLDPLPRLNEVPLESPLRAWLEGGMLELEPEPPPVPIDLPLERLIGPELLLLRERPPRPASDAGLVILTRVGLRDEPDADRVWLDLAGSGPVVGVWMQPLDEFRMRLTIPDAGAVPAFVTARPENSAVIVLDVARRERDVELELALAPGWRLAEIGRLDNGAAVGFAWSETE